MIEYVAIIIVLIGVFIAMGTYYKRSLQGRYRQAGDALGAGAQYHTNVAPIHYQIVNNHAYTTFYSYFGFDHLNFLKFVAGYYAEDTSLAAEAGGYGC